jgi:hypothetical protein
MFIPDALLHHLNFNFNEAQNLRLHRLAADPSTPVEGQIWLNTTDHKAKYYDGSNTIILWGFIYNVLGTLPIVVNVSAGVATVSINAATTSTAGSMSAADKTKLDAATATNTANTLVLRDANGRAQFADPASAQDAATKNYVDNAVTGFDYKQSVRLASAGNVAGTYNATGGTSGRGQFTAMTNTLDGVSLAAGNRVLLKDQTTGAQNGIWVVTTLGTGSNGVWDRATDFDQDAEVTAGIFITVEEGNTNDNTLWLLTTNNPITIGGGSGTALAFMNFPAAGTIVGGAGLLLTGNVLDVQSANTGIKVNGDNVELVADAATFQFGNAATGLQVKTAGISGTMLASAIFGTGLTFSAGIASVTSYTPVTSATVGRVRVFASTSVGDAQGQVTLTHNFNTKSISVGAVDPTNNKYYWLKATPSTTNAVIVEALGTTKTLDVFVMG